jgi:hypothetical protein
MSSPANVELLEFFDHSRMCEDFLATSGHFLGDKGHRGRVSAPIGVLSRLGDDLLHATVADAGAWSLRQDWDLLAGLKKRIFGFACRGTMPINYAIAAAIFGRKDLQAHFFVDAWFNMDRALTWFILHGIVEHRLWHFLTDDFLTGLMRKIVPIGRGIRISPLEFLLLLERPDFAKTLPSNAGAQEVDGRLRDWIKTDAIPTYRLGWISSLLSPDPRKLVTNGIHGDLPAEVAEFFFVDDHSPTSTQIQAKSLVRRCIDQLPQSLPTPIRIGQGTTIKLRDLLVHGMSRDGMDGSILFEDSAICFVIPPQIANRDVVILESQTKEHEHHPVSFGASLPEGIRMVGLKPLDEGCSAIPMRSLPIGPAGGRVLLLAFQDFLHDCSVRGAPWLIRNIWIL